jgi:hypothetical protein
MCRDSVQDAADESKDAVAVSELNDSLTLVALPECACTCVSMCVYLERVSYVKNFCHLSH